MELISVFLKAFLIDNIVLMSFLALCPFIGMSTDNKTAIGMGGAVIFVTVIATAVTFPIYQFLKANGMEFLQTLAFILVIASLVQLLEFFLKKSIPALYNSMGIYFALITTNCAILGCTLNAVSKVKADGSGYSYLDAIVYSIGLSLGFMLALLLLAGIRKRISSSPVPAFLKGTPVLFAAAALMSMAFMGFGGLVK
ncbi:MAG: electron transport complex subunit RsxA [Spirochaetaceae bacterium]|jgi:electron transport complex protein RnfA|nr:electron transport complex subunit RsxA [Spirochaetaceae bacterium]